MLVIIILTLADALRGDKARHHGQSRTTITLANVNNVAESRLLPHSFKEPLITDFDSSTIMTSSTITSLIPNHNKVIEIYLDETRYYIQSKKIPEIQTVFEFPASSAITKVRSNATYSPIADDHL
ncbi:hypothetical protein TNCV_4564451 [Trichonephila clavipes]|nr:hypothetical protein TNCV_4564451 [Trichonephila clavipes]